MTKENNDTEPQEIEMNFSIVNDETNGNDIINMVNQTLQNVMEMEEEHILQMAIQNTLESSSTVGVPKRLIFLKISIFVGHLFTVLLWLIGCSHTTWGMNCF